MIIISAMSNDRIIGSGDGMPWEVPGEYQHFLDTTGGHTLIMGRRSYEIFAPTLTCRDCYVITRGSGPFEKGIAVASLEAAIQQASRHNNKTFVAGGASIYAQAIAHAETMLLSYIQGDFQGDAFFPKFDAADWKVTFREDRGAYELVEYVRAT